MLEGAYESPPAAMAQMAAPQMAAPQMAAPQMAAPQMAPPQMMMALPAQPLPMAGFGPSLGFVPPALPAYGYAPAQWQPPQPPPQPMQMGVPWWSAPAPAPAPAPWAACAPTPAPFAWAPPAPPAPPQLLAMAMTQEGSKQLQRQLRAGPPAAAAAIVDELAPHLAALAQDAFGNYLVSELAKLPAAHAAVRAGLGGRVCD